jgi:CDGSH-type Zn-finger protein
MARLVEREATGPRRLDESDIDPEKGDIAVCQCGLSAEYPFCDGSHRVTEDEGEGTYRYERVEGALVRQEVDRVVAGDADGAPDGEGPAE